MKRIFTILAIVILAATVFAQAPQKMSYQAVIRDAGNALITSHAVGMQISILQGSATGTPMYVETQTPTTNANGLITIEIGGGTIVTGTFAGIDWSSGLYFIKTETDPTGGTSYTITGTNQILSVPYALYSKTAGNGSLWSQSGSNIYHSSGNVGIGISDPTYDLDVRGSNSDDDGVVQIGNSDLSHRIILFGGRQNDPNPFISWKQGDPLRFATDEDGWSEKMRITGDGLVGIGTLTPTSKLDVTGEINVNSNKIINVADPVDAQDAATKAYVDTLKQRILKLEEILGIADVTDVDGNIYKTVKIGNQIWMAENLKTEKYKDGTAIPMVTDNTAWAALTTPSYCWYDNDEAANKNTYGALYNWYTVNTGKLCPAGWHVPTDAEWTTLENYLIAIGFNYDGTTTENKIAKSLASSSGWSSSTIVGAIGNTDYPAKRNISGFAAFPGAVRESNGEFNFIGDYGFWWSSTEDWSFSAWLRGLYYDNSSVGRASFQKQAGLSVRCLRD